MSTEFEEFINKEFNRAASDMGQEKIEELEEDFDFVGKIMGSEVKTMASFYMISCLALLAGAGDLDDVINLTTGLMLGAIVKYRDFLIEKGVDLRTLEGRNV